MAYGRLASTVLVAPHHGSRSSSSQIFIDEVNPQAVYHYVGYEFVPAPDTMFRHVHKLPPGHYLQFKNGQITVQQYWDLAFQDEGRTPRDYADQMRDILTESVRKRLISDVPLGVFLSGGLDSSTLVALMSHCGVDPIKTFSLGYEDETFCNWCGREVEDSYIEHHAYKNKENYTDINTFDMSYIVGNEWEDQYIGLGSGGEALKKTIDLCHKCREKFIQLLKDNGISIDEERL